MSFANRLRELRLENKLTQKELAEIIGVHKSAISFWEIGANEPKINYVVKLCNFFCISLEDLIDDPEEFQNPNNEWNKANQDIKLSQEEKEILKLYNQIDPQYKDNVLVTMELFAEKSKSMQKKKPV